MSVWEEAEGGGVNVVRESANYKRELILVPLIAIGCYVCVCVRVRGERDMGEERAFLTW